MSGYTKIKLYHYSSLESRCKTLGEFNSFKEVQDKYYSGSKYPLFKSGWDSDIHELPDGTYLTKFKIYRDDLIKKIRLSKDPLKLGIKTNNVKPIIVKNMNGEVIAEFINANIASKLLGVHPGKYLQKKTNSTPFNSLYNITMEYK